MTEFLWGAYPYICLTLFFAVPVIRMVFRPFSWTTRASGLFNRDVLGLASLLLHWGILFVLLGHIAGWTGGVLGHEGSVLFFYWIGLLGGVMTFAGSVIALVRRLTVPEVRAMSQTEDYIIHVFLISILGLALYQVLIDRIFGVTYTAAAWFASIWAFSPQPELMASASFLSKFHVFLALTFFAYLPFTKLVHLWTFPINYFVRPYQSMRTVRFWAQRKWELSLRSDKSFLVYGLSFFAIGAFILSLFLGSPTLSGLPDMTDGQRRGGTPLLGYPLYVSQCARCHGNEGAGDGPGANSPNFASLPRDLIAADYRFVSTDNGIASDEDLYRTLADGLPKAGMPAFDQLSHEQIQSLVTVMKRFWKDRSEPGQTIEIAPRPVVTNETIDVGRALYADSCAMCHGERGLGDGDAGEFIQDLQGHAVVPTNLAQGELKAGRNPEQIYLRVAAGIPGGESGFLMPPFDFLSAEETWAIVEYLEAEILPPKN